ncbi:MAG: type II secretion system protein, partial [Moraxellaceae bacterium]
MSCAVQLSVFATTRPSAKFPALRLQPCLIHSEPCMNRKLGFSLIELLVVLAVVAFLAFVTVPLATGWIRNAQLEKDFAGLQRALGTAKALAMRNSTGAASSEPVAVLCRSGDVEL